MASTATGQARLQCSYLVLAALPVLCAVLAWHALKTESDRMICHTDYTEGGKWTCRPKCDKGFYSLPFMERCEPWLTCQQILSDDFKILEPLGAGAVKVVYLAEFQGFLMTINTLGQRVYKKDFMHGLNSLASLQPSSYVTQLIGHCKDMYVTEFHLLGGAEHLDGLLASQRYQVHNTLRTRFGLCVNYAKIIDFLHSRPDGARVMCDSNDLKKTLSQFLLTSSLNLVANDLDALPLISNSTLNHSLEGTTGIKCGHRQLYGDFVAPEQLWPFEDKPFDDTLMPGYNEKTDIWKIPDVCEYFLGQVKGSDSLRFSLFDIYSRCKSADASVRPTAKDVLSKLVDVQQSFDLE